PGLKIPVWAEARTAQLGQQCCPKLQDGKFHPAIQATGGPKAPILFRILLKRPPVRNNWNTNGCPSAMALRVRGLKGTAPARKRGAGSSGESAGKMAARPLLAMRLSSGWGSGDEFRE